MIAALAICHHTAPHGDPKGHTCHMGHGGGAGPVGSGGMGAGQAKQGWYEDPYGVHQMRYFSAGQPTRLVRDGDRDAYDDPPSTTATVDSGSGQDAGFWPAYTPTAPTAPTAPIAPAAPTAPTATEPPATAPPPVADPGWPQPSLADITPAPRRASGRKPALLVATVLMALLIAGIVLVTTGHGSTADPTRLILAAASTTEHSSTAHLTSTLSINTMGLPLPPITMSGASDFAARATEMQLNAGGFSATIRYVNGVEYFQSSLIPLPGGAHWVTILPEDLGVSAGRNGALGGGNPADGLQFLGAAAGTPEIIGRDRLGDVGVTDYAVTLDLSSLLATMSQAGKNLSPTFARGLEALRNQVDLTRIPAEVWLDAQGRVRRFDLTLNLQVAGTALNEVQSTTFSDFGAPVHVTAPLSTDTVPFATVKARMSSILSGGKAAP